MSDFDWTPFKALAKVLVDGGEAELDQIKEEYKAALESIQEQALEQAQKLVEAKLKGDLAEIVLRKEALEDLEVQASGTLVNAALDATDAVRERLKGFVKGAFGILKEMILGR